MSDVIERSSVMEVKPWGSKGRSYWFYCPGCKCMHMYVVQPQGVSWTFNGNLERPTFEPSLLCNGDEPTRCHLFLRDGVIEFLPDCYHELKGKKVPLEPMEGKPWVR